MSSLDKFLEVLFKFLIVAGIAATIALIVFFFWTAWFIPVVQKLKIDERKKKLTEEEHKIEVQKANAVLVVEDKKKELEDVIKQKMEEELQLHKLRRKNAKIVDSIEAMDKLEAEKAKKTKSNKSEK